MLRILFLWIKENNPHVIVITNISFFAAIFTIITGIVITIILPQDYFLRERKIKLPEKSHPNFVPILFLIILKNTTGIILLIAGIIMLFLPGQGLLTILISIALIDFPGKWNLQKKLIKKTKILKGANLLRKEFDKPDLIPPE